MKIKFTLPALLAVVALTMAGCSTEAWYEGMRLRAENECRHQPPDASERCLERLNKKTHQEYEKERSEQKQ